MCAQLQEKTPFFLFATLANKCPRCGRGDMYKNEDFFRIKGLMAMNQRCPVCG